MKYSVIGSGSIGKALARRFSRSGIELGIANTRGAESLVSLVSELGNKVIPLTDAEQRIAKLVGDLRFAAIALGRVDEGGKLLSIDGPLMLQNLIKHG
jgi:predicted dinucleotide-binding enzyme